MNKLSRMLPVLVALLLVSNPALAQDAGADVHAFDYLGYVGIGAGIAIGFAALGGGIGQGLAASGALQGIARNPSASGKIFTPMIIGLALIESLVIYALVIGFLLTDKIDNVGDAITNAGTSGITVDIDGQQAQRDYDKKVEEEEAEDE